MAGLPFLRAKKLATIIIAHQKPSGELETKGEEGEADPALMAAAQDLISGIHSKDAESVASAIQAAFDILDSQEENKEKE